MSIDLWNIDYIQAIGCLKHDSEVLAKRLRYMAMALAAIAVVMFLAVGCRVIQYEPQAPDTVTWGAVRFSAGMVIAALPLFLSRLV